MTEPAERMTKFEIRAGTEPDLPAVWQLIKELAIYEREPEAVVTTVETMRADGFGSDPVFSFFVAEVENEVVGIALFYDRYSTWRGRCLYLEDFVVTDQYRGCGIGRALFDRTVQKARDEGYRGMSWQVLDWNEPAINFYKKHQTNIEDGWLNCGLSFEQLQAYV